MPSDFTERTITVLWRVPPGRVVTYGLVATLAGNPRGARQVVRILNSYAEKLGLPWHRVINAQGRISLPRGGGYELQRALLCDEGVEFTGDDTIDLNRFQYRPRRR